MFYNGLQVQKVAGGKSHSLRQHSYKRAGWPTVEDFADGRREEALNRDFDESVHMGETTRKATGGAELRRGRPAPSRLGKRMA